MTAPILVFAIGNVSRGDDALGPELLRRLAQCLSTQGPLAEAEFLEDFQLQIEHAMDMQGRELVLFVDAGMDTPAPFSFQRLQFSADPILYSHALAPSAMLAVYREFYGEMPPPAFVLCIRGERFELGEPLTVAAQDGLERACDFAMQLLSVPDVADWDRKASGATCMPGVSRSEGGVLADAAI